MSTATPSLHHPSDDTLHRVIVDSPVGPLTITASDRGLRAIAFPARDDHDVPVPVGRIVDGPNAVTAAAADQLGEYFAGRRREFDLPLDPVGTDFQLKVWHVLRTIPYGRTMSYGEQAARLGDARKARAVGAANGRNPIPIVVPCHRVVGSTGKLTGFAGGLDVKARLLDHERGVQPLIG